jgi:hypothetical protein
MMADADALLARFIRDPAASTTGAHDLEAVIAAASRHRVSLLLGSQLREAGILERWPNAFVEEFEQVERQAIAMDCIRQKELAGALAELASAGTRALLFKGAAVSHTHYPQPHLRVRADTDVLVAAQDVPVLERIFTRRGYAKPAETSGAFVSYQTHYQKTDAYGVTHAFDVHWKISNLQSLADRVSHAELWDRRVPIRTLGPAAFTIDTPSALLLALLHRAGHHPGSRNLLWLYDLHLLARDLSHGQMRKVADDAVERGLAGITADGLALTRDYFGGEAVEILLAALHSKAWREDEVLTMGESFTLASVLRLDLEALPTWRARGQLLREHVLPSASYMRARYGVRSNGWLPGLYLWRLVFGMPKWLLPRTHRS